jgi:hypothetical protein
MSAALPFAQHGALTRGSHAAGSHVLATCHVLTLPCGRSTKPTAACGSAQHGARGGKLRQGMACGIP